MIDKLSRAELRKLEVRNAIIKSCRISSGDHGGVLTAWIDLEYGDGSCQGWGGLSLYLDKSYKHHKLLSHAGHWIYRTMQIAGVENWASVVGKAIRVSHDGVYVRGIGHIINDDWFWPELDFAESEE